jgi:hypothetical protein
VAGVIRAAGDGADAGGLRVAGCDGQPKFGATVAAVARRLRPGGWLVFDLHTALQLHPPRPDHPAPRPDLQRIRRRSVLGGLISEYERAA